MRRLAFFLGAVVFLLGGSLLQATIFGKIQGIVHDPQHRPVSGATVLLQAVTSDWSQTSKSDDNGEFTFTAVPVGDYKITVTQAKFQTVEQTLTVTSGSSPVLHFQLAIASVTKPPSSPEKPRWSTWTRSRRQRSLTASTSPRLPVLTAPTAYR